MAALGLPLGPDLDWLRMASRMASASAKSSSSGVECRLTAMWVELEEGRGGVSAPWSGFMPDMMAGCGGERVLLQNSPRSDHTGTRRRVGGCRIAVPTWRARSRGTEEIFKWSRGSGNCGPGKGQEIPIGSEGGEGGLVIGEQGRGDPLGWARQPGCPELGNTKRRAGMGRAGGWAWGWLVLGSSALSPAAGGEAGAGIAGGAPRSVGASPRLPSPKSTKKRVEKGWRCRLSVGLSVWCWAGPRRLVRSIRCIASAQSTECMNHESWTMHHEPRSVLRVPPRNPGNKAWPKLAEAPTPSRAGGRPRLAPWLATDGGEEALPSQQSGCIRFGGCAVERWVGIHWATAAHPDSGWGSGEPMVEPEAEKGRPQQEGDPQGEPSSHGNKIRSSREKEKRKRTRVKSERTIRSTP